MEVAHQRSPLNDRLADRLDSWKEIARHLGRTVRTVQRWEQFGLPVLRHEHNTGSSIYAYRSELDHWWSTRRPAGALADADEDLPSPHAHGLPRLAVLPFSNSGAENAGYFAEGFVDELITRLAADGSVAIISRTSSMQFHGRATTPLDRVARMLSATLLVEGSVNRDGEQLLVSVRLVDPFDAGRVIWVQQYGCRHPEVRQLQAQVAQDIIHQVTHNGHGAVRPPDAPARVVPEAHDAYLMGRHYLHKRALPSLLVAIERFRQAIAFDPTDAKGYAGLAETYALISGNEFWAPDAGFPRAKQAALHALERDPNNAQAHAALGLVTGLYEWQWDDADREFETAVRLNPNYADAWHWRGVTRLNAGRIHESLDPLRTAVELDPLSPIIVANSGRPHHFLGRYDEAMACCHQTLSFAPDFWIAHLYRAWAFSAQGQPARAREAARDAIELSRGNSLAVLSLAEAEAAGGDAAAAQRVVDDLLANAHSPDGQPAHVSGFRVARVFARLEQSDTAFEWLERSRAERSLGNSSYITLDPALASLRADSRFIPVAASLGLM